MFNVEAKRNETEVCMGIQGNQSVYSDEREMEQWFKSIRKKGQTKPNKLKENFWKIFFFVCQNNEEFSYFGCAHF